MSACYHVCPNHSNFQFDTAFMYTIAILILLKIYQTRHPDINANAYTAFGALAFIIFIGNPFSRNKCSLSKFSNKHIFSCLFSGVIGVLHANVYFWIFFTSLHIISCLFLSVQIYYMGRWKLDAGIFRRVWVILVNDTKALCAG